MKKTQMIHSPRTFKLGLGLIIAASLAAMPVLTGASDRADAAKAKSDSKARAVALAKETPTKEKNKESASVESKKRATEAEARSKARRSKLENEAQKLAAKLTPTQKSKILSLLGDEDVKKLLTKKVSVKSKAKPQPKTRKTISKQKKS